MYRRCGASCASSNLYRLPLEALHWNIFEFNLDRSLASLMHPIFGNANLDMFLVSLDIWKC